MADLHAGVAAGSYLCDVTISLHTLTQIQPDSVLTLDTPVLSNILAISKLNDPPAANRQQEDYTTRYISTVYIAQQTSLTSHTASQIASQTASQTASKTANKQATNQSVVNHQPTTNQSTIHHKAPHHARRHHLPARVHHLPASSR